MEMGKIMMKKQECKEREKKTTDPLHFSRQRIENY